jgi:hypothetical protein
VDEGDRVFTWVCPECGKRIEETNVGVLEALKIAHESKCEAGKPA